MWSYFHHGIDFRGKEPRIALLFSFFNIESNLLNFREIQICLNFSTGMCMFSLGHFPSYHRQGKDFRFV